LKPGTFIIPYLGRVHPGTAEATDPNSDYDLWLDHDADLAVDASKQGNEARFVNDYRGVREKPNAEFGTAWCERWGQLCVGFWVLDAGKAKAKASGKAKVDKARQQGIKKGEEILVSYGKGFWGERMGSTQEEGITE
jgi:SET domain-containing protein